MLKMIRKIISGGQTGADRAGLDFAIEAGLEHGGYVPRGRKAEDGRIDDRYNLIELSTSSYPARTRRNIEKSDGTVIFSLERAQRRNQADSGTCQQTREAGAEHL
jgi:predicted Rossmann-fold nucleotide-binding protein